MSENLTQQILDLIYTDHDVRRRHKESVTNWILDTQPHRAPLSTVNLVEYLAAFQPELLDRLKVKLHLRHALARALETVERN